MSAHDDSKPIANTPELVKNLAEQLRNALCDHQAFFLIVLDDHAGVMPAAEDMTVRPSAERKRAADVLRMWAARIESGRAPDVRKA